MGQDLTINKPKQIKGPYPPRVGDWPQIAVDLLIDLYHQNLSMSDIANHVGRTRNAVAGQIRKLRAKGVELPSRRDYVPRKKVKAIFASKPFVPKAAKPVADPEPIEKPVRTRLKLVESPTAVTMLELEPHHCKYPIGDPRQSDFRFCGGMRLPDRPYCQEHTVLTDQHTTYQAPRGKLRLSSRSSSS